MSVPAHKLPNVVTSFGNHADPSNTKNLEDALSKTVATALTNLQKQILLVIDSRFRDLQKQVATVEKNEITLTAEIVQNFNPIKAIKKVAGDFRNSFSATANSLWANVKKSVEIAFKRGSEQTKREFKQIKEPAQPDDTRHDKRVRNVIFENIKSMLDQLVNEQEAAVNRVMTEAALQNLSNDEVRRRVDVIFSKTRTRADTTVRTELIRAAAAAKRAKYEAAGIEEWVWVTEQDERVCELCLGLDGSIVAVGSKFGDDRFDQDLFQPPAHPNCRCSVALVKAP